MAENKPGTGSTSPFGNGAGATSAGAAGGNDFNAKPAGDAAGGGGHDFVTDPAGDSTAGQGGRDFTKESRAQQSGPPADLCTDSIVAGSGPGRVPLADPPASRDPLIGTVPGAQRMPFKLKG